MLITKQKLSLIAEAWKTLEKVPQKFQKFQVIPKYINMVVDFILNSSENMNKMSKKLIY